MSTIRNITAGVALVAATAFGGTMVLAAAPPAGATGATGSDQKADVAQGQADLATNQAGTDEAKDVATNEIDNAAQNDGQIGQVGEKDETASANQADKSDNETGASGESTAPKP